MNTFLDFEVLLETHRAEAPSVIETFIRLAYAPVRRLTTCLLADPAQAGALTPILLQSACEYLPQYPVGTSFAVWLFALVVQGCRKHQRRARWRQGKQKAREVRSSAFANLPEHGRAVLFLYGLDLEITDIAVILQRREGTLQKDLDEGLLRLGIEGTEEEVKTPLRAELAREYPTPSEPEEGFPALIERLTPRGTPRPAQARRFTRWTEWAWAGVALIVLLGVFWTFSRTGHGDNMTLPLFPSPTPPLPDILQPQTANVSTQLEVELQNSHYAADPMISGDGGTVAYVMNNENGQNLYLYEREAGQATIVDLIPESVQNSNNFYLPDLSDNGQRIVFIAAMLEGNMFPCSGNASYLCEPLVLYDRNLQTWTIVTANETGDLANGSSYPVVLSGDGRYVAFWSTATNLVPEPEDTCPANDYMPSCGDLFVKDLETGQFQRIAIGTTPNETVRSLSFSTLGEWLVYSLVNQDQTEQASPGTNVYAVSLPDGEIHPINVASDGKPGNGPSFQGVISRDGRYVAFVSAASNLVAGDTNGVNDVFRHDLQTGETVRISVGAGGVQAEGQSGLYGVDADWYRNLAISSDGQRVVFLSYAENLFTDEEAIWCVPDSNPTTCYGVFLYDQATQRTTQLNIHTGHRRNAKPLIFNLSLSNDGRQLTFQEILWYMSDDCMNGNCADIFLYDLEENITLPISRPQPAADGEERWHFQTYLEGTTGWVNGVAYSPAGDLASADNKNLLMWNFPKYDNAKTVAADSGPLQAVTFSMQGWLAAGDVHGNVCIYPLSADDHDRCLRDHPGQVRSLAFSPDGELLAVGTLGAVRIWRNVEGQFVHVREYPYPGGLVESVAFSPDGALLATAVDEEVWIRRVTTGEVIARLAGNVSEDVFDLAFSPDGQYLASGAEGHLAVLWQVVKSGDTWTFVYLHSFKHLDWPRALAFSPDSTLLAVGTFDSSIVLWHLPDGQYIDTLRRTTQEQVLDLAFSPDGKQIAAGTVYGVRVWAYGTEAGDESLAKYFNVTENDATVWTNKLYLIPNFSPRETTVVHTLEEAQALVSFPITTWETLPEGFTLSEIYVFRELEDLEVVSIFYLQTTSFQPSSLILTESKTNPLFFDFPISRYARVSTISVGLWPGEFVSGGWNIGNTITTPEGQPNYERFWDPELASLWLRWQEGNRYFALLYDQPYNQQNITETERFTSFQFLELADSLMP